MKKVSIAIILLSAVVFYSCSLDKNPKSTAPESEQVDSLKKIIQQQADEMDDMMGAFNEIQEGLRIINASEGKLSRLEGDAVNNTEAIKEEMIAISQQMERNRELIEKLKQKLRTSLLDSEQLQKTIENLTNQLNEKDAEIKRLQRELEEKNIHIEELDAVVDNLTSNVDALTAENKNQDQKIAAQEQQLNTAWYVFGTKKELKNQNIIDGDKVLQGNFNKDYFTKIDIRVDKEIRLYSKSAKIMTNHPSNSYTLKQDANKQYVLRIVDADAFWSASKYLVVQVK